MDIIYILSGIIIGGIAGWFIAILKVKSNYVSRNELEQVTSELNENKTALKLEQEKNKQIAESILMKENELKVLREENKELNVSIASYIADLKTARENIQTGNNEIKDLKNDIKEKTNEFNEANKQVAKLTAENEALNEKLKTQKSEIEELKRKFNLEFENIATKILEEKTRKFTIQNKENLETILKPLGENIEKFKKKVEEVYDKESKERFSLGNEVKKLLDLNHKISEEAHNLTNALKGNSKTQGDWGQMILENILEQSGLVKDREYFVQEYLKDKDGNYLKNEDGKKMQPDIIIKYPDERKVIVDSKVSLTAYTRYTGSDDIEVQKKALQDHIKSIRRHIDELSGKNYQDFASSLDFVMMFVPNEPAYLLALKNDPDLWHYAYNKRIILISPTNLIAALKLIEDLWKREYQNRNAEAISKRGEILYDKFVGFVQNLMNIGNHIKKTQESYDAALGQLKSGNGNLIGQAQKLKDLGVKSKKSLPTDLVNDAISNETS